MEFQAFLKMVAHVNSGWSLAAFSIAAVLAVLNIAYRGNRRTATTSLLWASVLVIFVLGLAPTLANAYLKHLEAAGLMVYRVRVIVLDPEHIPISGAVLRTDASNETTETSQGIGVVAVYGATLSADHKVTVYADLSSAFLHGKTEVQLGNDPNPSITIQLSSNVSTSLSGLVEDSAGHAISGATVTVVGGESTSTAPNGTFTVKTNAAVDQEVRLHVEKVGYSAVDQDHPAGRGPVTIQLKKNRGSR